ncbi:protein mono-ADP-ribosyltransferase PARP15-like [Vanacampus margaritifer]
MEKRNGYHNIEKRLFHGTSHKNVHDINVYGFNRSFAGKHGTQFGNGTYFAVAAEYSTRDHFSPPNAQEEKCMYLCRVPTVNFTAGKPNKGTSLQKYDSVVDNVHNPSIFVIFHDTQVYPEYLITFN